MTDKALSFSGCLLLLSITYESAVNRPTGMAVAHAIDRVSGIGARALRLEDPSLLRGAEFYTADLDIDGVLHAVFVRSQVAHARIAGVDTRDAGAQPGVVAVLTGADLDTPQVFYPAFGELIASDYHRVPLATD